MHSKHGPMALAAVLAWVLALAGCHQADGPGSAAPDDDAAGDGDTDVDGDADSDTDTDADSECEPMSGWVGYPCVADPDPCPELSCEAAAFCLVWAGETAGVCTRECVPATEEEPVDGCDMTDVVCMDIAPLTADTADDEDGHGVCLEECVVTPYGNECQADYIKCDPDSWSLETESATCLLPKCESDADCVTASGPSCATDGECDATEGEWCADDGYCVFEAECNTLTGRCNWEGNAGAEIGDPCESLWDCNDNEICLLPGFDDHGKPVRQHGYCSKLGCKVAVDAEWPDAYGEVDAEFGCGMLGSCTRLLHRSGLCLRRCAPDHSTDAFRCRQAVWDGEVEDTNGQYECIDGTDIFYTAPDYDDTEMYAVHPYPACAWVGSDLGLKCGDGDGEHTPMECYELFASSGSWSLNMDCRDPATGEGDTDGYCLDDTTSGPTETW